MASPHAAAGDRTLFTASPPTFHGPWVASRWRASLGRAMLTTIAQRPTPAAPGARRSGWSRRSNWPGEGVWWRSGQRRRVSSGLSAASWLKSCADDNGAAVRASDIGGFLPAARGDAYALLRVPVRSTSPSVCLLTLRPSRRDRRMVTSPVSCPSRAHRVGARQAAVDGAVAWPLT